MTLSSYDYSPAAIVLMDLPDARPALGRAIFCPVRRFAHRVLAISRCEAVWRATCDSGIGVVEVRCVSLSSCCGQCKDKKVG